MRTNIEKILRTGTAVLILVILFVALIILALSSRDIAKRLAPRERLWLGVEALPMNDTMRQQFGVNGRRGVLVNQVIESSPASRAGLRRGDVILTLDDTPMVQPNDVPDFLAEGRSRDPVQIIYLRDGMTYSTMSVLEYRALNASAPRVRSIYHYHLTFADFLAFFSMGILVDTLAAFIGSGGGVLKVSLLLAFFGVEIFLAKVLSILSSGCMGLSASHQYLKTKQVDRKCLQYLIPSSIVGAICGVGISVLVGRHFLETLLAFFLIFVGIENVLQVVLNVQGKLPDEVVPEDHPFIPDRPYSLLILAGFPAGVFSTVLGITGGIVGEPLHRILLKAPLRTCIANTVVTVVFDAFLGGGMLLMIDGLMRERFAMGTFLQIWMAIVPGSLIGGQLGAMLNGAISVNGVKGVYAVVVFMIAAKLLFSM
jgi:uncharacterized protein